MNHWIIINNHQHIEGIPRAFNGINFTVYSENEIVKQTVQGKEYGLLVDGYVLPATGDNLFQNCSGSELVFKSLSQYHFDFINHLKGVFVLVLLTDENCLIYTDQLGLKKAFFSIEDDKIIFSNNFWEVKKRTKQEILAENIAINSLFNHYIEGITIYQNLFYSVRSKEYTINKEGLSQRNYFDIQTLFDSKKNKIKTSEFSEYFQSIVNQYIDLLNIKRPAVTLTGGFDSRIMLGALLNKGLKPVAFNYGNPESKDVVIAKQISEKFQLPFYNNNLENVSPGWFDELSEVIVSKGNAITQMHRAHRLDTVIKLCDFHEVDAVFGGYMGGEGILGIYYDDLITSEFVRRKWSENNGGDQLISEILKKKFIHIDDRGKQSIQNFISTLPYFGPNHSLNHFLFSYRIKGEVHHVQDVNLFSHYVPYSIPIFLDLDYLKKLFSSEFSFLFKNNESRNPITRINYYRYYAEMIRNLYPALGNIPLAKTGYYTPDEYLSNKLVYMGKRLIRHFFTEKKYKPNFRLEGWMKDFVEQKIPVLKKSPIADFIDIKQYETDFHSKDPKLSEEKHWQKYSDLIMADKIINHNI